MQEILAAPRGVSRIPGLARVGVLHF